MQVTLILCSLLFVGCGDDDSSNPIAGCTDENSLNFNPNATQEDGSCVFGVAIDFTFTHNWDGVAVTGADLSTTDYTTEIGQEINISRLRHLVSRFTLTNADTQKVYNLGGYHLTDLSITSTYEFDTDSIIPEGNYKLSFVYGFNETDNVDGAYADLNSVSWNWPAPLGGGYHFLQMDGNYNVNSDSPKPFNFHNGTARISEGNFEQNFVVFNLPNILVLTENSNIEIKMNIAEWFKNPYTWDLEVYDTPLMPNYDAQKLMQQNATTVFTAIAN